MILRAYTCLILLLFLLVLSSACSDRSTRVEPANLLLLVVDCLRADHVSVNGYHRCTTPNIDLMAQESVNFSRAYSQAIWTHPSVPTILTGLYPSEHGLLDVKRDERGRAIGPALAPSVATLAERLKAAGYSTALVGEQAYLSPAFGLEQGFDYYHYRASDASNIHRRFFQWLGSLETPRFFAYLHYLELHWPYCPPQFTQGKFDPGKSKVEFCSEWRKLRTDLRTGAVVLNEDDRQTMVARYDEELLALDHKLGELFSGLKQRGLWDDLLVALTADHGEEFLEHGGICHESGPWDELLSVPLIIKPPASFQAPRGSRVDTLVELRDLISTFLEAAGIQPEVGSRSLTPWLRGRSQKAPKRSFIVAETLDHITIRTESMKLLYPRKGEEVTLFDLDQDPGETRNVAPCRQEDLSRMMAYLLQWQKGIRKAAPPLRQEIDDETVEELRALGYLD